MVVVPILRTDNFVEQKNPIKSITQIQASLIENRKR